MTGSADIPSRPPSPASTRRVPADIDNGPRKMEDTEKEAVEAFRSGLRKHKSCNDKLRLPALRDDEWLDKLINELRDAETHMRLRPVRPDTPIEPGNFVFLDPSDGGLFCRVMDEYDRCSQCYKSGKGWQILFFVVDGSSADPSTEHISQSRMKWVLTSGAATDELPADLKPTNAEGDGGSSDATN